MEERCFNYLQNKWGHFKLLVCEAKCLHFTSFSFTTHTNVELKMNFFYFLCYKPRRKKK